MSLQSVPTLAASIARPYMTVAQLAEISPWSVDAIGKKIKRGHFIEGQHFFRRDGQLIFAWQAICDYIAGKSGKQEPKHQRREPRQVDAQATEQRLQGLLRRTAR